RHRAQEVRQTELRDRILFGEITRTSSKLSQTASRAAHLQREVGSIGQRTKTLEFVREAARLAPSIELREQALSALLLPDVGTNLTWRPEQGFEIASAYDAVFEHFIMNNDRGRAIIQQV